MKELVWDIEANGLLEDSTSIHCISIKDLYTNTTSTYSLDTLTKDNIFNAFNYSTKIIGHNIIGYDIPMIKKFYGIDLVELVGKGAIVDTYLMSLVLFPDRQLPRGCPTFVLDPFGRMKKIGPHSLEAWGYRVGVKKIEIHDWRYFTPEIISRCEVDVEINEKVYYKLLEEAGLNELD